MKDGCKFFTASLTVREFLCPLPLNLGKLCDCFYQQNTVDVMPIS